MKKPKKFKLDRSVTKIMFNSYNFMLIINPSGYNCMLCYICHSFCKYDLYNFVNYVHVELLIFNLAKYLNI